MANDVLKRYITERLLELDPTLSDSPGAPMYRLVIDPLVDRLGVDPMSVNIEQFIIDRLKEDPLTAEIDIESRGSFIKDILARPLALLLEPLQREIQFLKTQQSFANGDELASEEVDALLSNVFATRAIGDLARGVVRIFYSTPQPVSMDASIIFYTASGLQFVPQEPVSFVAADFTKSGDLYYIDVDVQSVVPHIGANVDRDAIKFVDGLPNVVRVTNPSGMSGGVSRETDQEFITKAENSLSERSLNTKRGIAATLSNNFSQLRSVQVYGYGDPEMQRDIIRGTVNVDIVGGLDEVGALLHTSATANVTAVDMRSANYLVLDNWTNNFLFSNKLAYTAGSYSGAESLYELTSDAESVRIIEASGLDTYFDPDLIGSNRGITEITVHDASGVQLADISDTAARQIHYKLGDFEIVRNGGTGGSPSVIANTAPNSNRFHSGGDAYFLRNGAPSLDTGLWRGAPLPFTDLLNVDTAQLNDPASYTPVADRDFLIVRGHTSDSQAAEVLRVFPIRDVPASGTIRVRREDSYMLSRDKVGLPLEYTFDKSAWMGGEELVIKAFGAPGDGDATVPAEAAVIFDGTDTVTGGTYGGVTAYILTAGTDNCYVELASGVLTNGWIDLGVEVGDFISLAAYDKSVDTTDTDSGGTFDGTAKFDWWQWGRVSEISSGGDSNLIKVEGIVESTLSTATPGLHGWTTGKTCAAGGAGAFNGFDDANGKYVLHWTLYKAEYETLLPNDNIHVAYSDFAYLPAYDTTGYDDGVAGPGVYNPPSARVPGVDGVEQTSNTDSTTNHYMYRYGTGMQAVPTGAVTAKRVDWAIARLGKAYHTYTQVDPTRLAIEADPSATTANIDASDRDNKYLTDGSGTLYTALHRPFNVRGWKCEDIGGASPAINTYGDNLRGLRGFTTPQTLNVSASPGDYAIQFFGAPESVDEYVTVSSLTISDIPGSYPFTDTLQDDLVINDNEVHVGGMTDVYIAGGGNTEDVASFVLKPKTLSVEDLSDNDDDGYDIVFYSETGTITNEATDTWKHKWINDTALVGVFTDTELQQSVLDMCVEVLDSNYPSIIGNVYNIAGEEINSGYLRFEEEINDSGGPVSLTYRILRKVTTNLIQPRDVLQEGSELLVPLEDKAVYNSVAFNADNSLIGSLYIELTSGNNRGEYVVTSVAGTKLTIDTSIVGIEDGVSFILYTKTSGVDRPMVRVTGTELSSTEDAGLTVPYGKPVDVLAESFSGLNNDPLVLTDMVLRDAGNYNSEPEYRSNVTTATIYIDDVTWDWVEQGAISLYDVVQITNPATAEDTFFWIVDILDGVSSTNSILVLDRELATSSSEGTSINGSVGKPSVGDMKLYFMEPTYVEVTASDTVFSTKEGAGTTLSFRPSPAESSDVYQSASFFTDVTITPDAGSPPPTATITSTTVDFEKMGLRIGDSITITKNVIVSSVITAATAADMSAIIGKSLVLSVDDVQRSVVFTPSSGLTLDNVVSQINSNLGAYVRAKKVASGSDWLLKLYSTNEVTVLDSGTNVLSTLGLTLNQSNDYGSAVVTITDITMVSTTTEDTSTITVADTNASGSEINASTLEVFLTVERPGSQIIFPYQMAQNIENGLYYMNVTGTSRAPLTTERLSEDTQLDVTGDTTLGYTLNVLNTNYSYSTAEDVEIVCTARILPEYATDWSTAFSTPGSTIEVSYERSQLVDDIQSFLLSDFDRVVNNNPLARHYFPAYGYIEIGTRGGASLDEQKAALVGYMATLYPNKPVEAFDIEMILARQGVTYVDHPLNMSFLTHDAGRNRVLVRSESALTLSKEFHIMDDDENISIVKA